MALAYLAFCWLLGVLAANFGGSDRLIIALAAWLVVIVWVAVQLPRSITLLAAFGALLVVAGAWHYNSSQPSDEPGGVAAYNNSQAVALRAVVSEEPDERESSSRLRLSVREVLTDADWQKAEGGVLVFLPTYEDYDYGDLLQVVGSLETPPQLDDFDYREYLARQGIASISYYPRIRHLEAGHGDPFKATTIEIRDRLSDSLHASLIEPQASLAEAFLIGRSASLSEDLTQDMRVTGTSHIVAISGYNITVVAALVLWSLAWVVGRRQAAVVALLVVAAYAVMAGLEPPVQRAAIMGSLYVIATLIGRPNSGSVSLLVAAAVMTAFDPLLVRDISFQLSFAAMLGLMTLAPALRERLRSAAERAGYGYEGPLASLADVLAVTLAAIAFTLPITAINFEAISLIAPLANLLIVPVFSIVLLTSVVLAISGVLVPVLGDILVFIAWPPLAYMTLIAGLLADIPAATVSISGFELPHAIAYYTVLLLITSAFTSRRDSSLLEPVSARLERIRDALRGVMPSSRPFTTSGLAILLVLGSIFIWLLVFNSPPSRLSVTFLDVGQGDAILIRTPAGHKILVDGGQSDEAIGDALGRHLPFWDRHLHLVVLTHPQADHLAGLLEVIDRYDVDQVLASPAIAETTLFRRWSELIVAEGMPHIDAKSGQWVDLGEGAWLSVLHPSSASPAGQDLNEGSVVMKLGWADVAFLLTGDIEADAETILASSGGVASNVLKLAHHGSATSTTTEFLEAVRPQVAVVSVGADNQFGHPAPEVLERLEDVLLFRTDQHGDVSISTDGRRLWVETQRR